MIIRTTCLAALLLAGTALPALAQRAPADVGQRVDKLEREMRAVQRKIFPGGGNQQFFEPDIPPPQPAAPAAGAAASAPIVDLTARVSSLEQALAKLTGEVETNSFKLRQLEDQVAKLNAAAVPLAAAPAATGATAPPAATAVQLAPEPAPAPGRPAAPASPPPGAPPFTDETASAPNTGDPAHDAYILGYRAWTAKRYADAQQTLKDVVAKYPSSKWASYAQNLYGRALLDDGQPAKAAEAFYSNYQKMPRGERAPDSLYFLGQSLMRLKPPKPGDACKVYGELIDVYGEKIDAALKDRVAKGQAEAKCPK